MGKFWVVAVFRVIPEHPTGLTDDDATTPTRDTKPASYALARSVPRVRRVCDGHGGTVVLAVGRVVAFVSCATPRGAGRNLNQRRLQMRGYGVLTAKLPSAAAGDLRDHRPCSQKTAMTSTAHGPARRRPPHDHRPWLVEVAFSGLFCFPPFDFAEECAWRRKCREEAQTPSMLLRLKKGGSRM